MSQTKLTAARARQILEAATRIRVLVLGDAMLDHFVWGSVARISPEAPVPVVDFERESRMPGGAANVARNLTALNVPTELLGVIGQDSAAVQLKQLLAEHHIGCRGLLASASRTTSVKTRIVAHRGLRNLQFGLTSSRGEDHAPMGRCQQTLSDTRSLAGSSRQRFYQDRRRKASREKNSDSV